MSNFWNWLEQRIASYEVARKRALKAYDTRWKQALAEYNDGVEPVMSAAGFHAPCDGYVHVWTEGGNECEGVYLAGQFLPASKERESIYRGAFSGQREFKAPIDRVGKFLSDWEELPASVRSVIQISRSRSFVVDDDVYCYVTISKCPADIFEAIEDKLMGDIYKMQRFAAEQTEKQRATRDAAHKAGENTPEGRVVITGTILAFKRQESMYGDVLKMLVQDDRGFRVWGSVPSSLDDAERESRITFTATVTASDKDAKFGFFKRPAKAAVIDTQEAA